MDEKIIADITAVLSESINAGDKVAKIRSIVNCLPLPEIKEPEIKIAPIVEKHVKVELEEPKKELPKKELKKPVHSDKRRK